MNEETQELKAKIVATLDTLPVDSLVLLADFVTFLGQKADQPQDITSLGGLWADTVPISEEEIVRKGGLPKKGFLPIKLSH